ncbi:membrane hypothetical protein [uncultured Thiomicrorhabdus sp.]
MVIMKTTFILLIYFTSFVYFTLIQGVDAYIKLEADYFNSEVIDYKKRNGIPLNKPVSPDVADKINEDFSSLYDKDSFVYNEVSSNMKWFSVLVLVVSFLLFKAFKRKELVALVVLAPYFYVYLKSNLIGIGVDSSIFVLPLISVLLAFFIFRIKMSKLN